MNRKQLLIIIGISIIVGVSVGVIFHTTKYYNHNMRERSPRFSGNRNITAVYKINSSYGWTSGILTCGIGLLIVGLKKNPHADKDVDRQQL